MTITGRQIIAARALLGLGQRELAEASEGNVNTIMRFETGQTVPRPATIKALQLELERRGIQFLNSGEPGVRVRAKPIPAENESAGK
jgi:transcriptional regulator with XRE-family HTH domain